MAVAFFCYSGISPKPPKCANLHFMRYGEVLSLNGEILFNFRFK